MKKAQLRRELGIVYDANENLIREKAELRKGLDKIRNLVNARTRKMNAYAKMLQETEELVIKHAKLRKKILIWPNE